MRIALLSDIHSNWPALKAVARDIEKMNVDRVYCLGDIIGYCAHPRECVDWVKNNADVAVAGNHEVMLNRGQAFKNGNEYAQVAAEKNREALTDEQIAYLKLRSLLVVDQGLDLTMAHANTTYPEGFDYIFNEEMAIDELIRAKTRFTAIGHTHKQRLFSRHDGVKAIEQGKEIDIKDGGKYLIDVGSVGQPRDNDSRAGYVILEVDKDKAVCFFRRVFYRIDQTVSKMEHCGYPEPLRERLFFGQ
ncbi:MAG: metallophosphoesterase family protein [Patescibacteria group bacterium]